MVHAAAPSTDGATEGRGSDPRGARSPRENGAGNAAIAAERIRRHGSVKQGQLYDYCRVSVKRADGSRSEFSRTAATTARKKRQVAHNPHSLLTTCLTLRCNHR